jgi:hypothetical protein
VPADTPKLARRTRHSGVLQFARIQADFRRADISFSICALAAGIISATRGDIAMVTVPTTTRALVPSLAEQLMPGATISGCGRVTCLPAYALVEETGDSEFFLRP